MTKAKRHNIGLQRTRAARFASALAAEAGSFGPLFILAAGCVLSAALASGQSAVEMCHADDIQAPPPVQQVSVTPGIYRIRFEALKGPGAGGEAKGKLTLMTFSGKVHRPENNILWGTLDADLTKIGGLRSTRQDNLMATDEIAPGALVRRSDDATVITLGSFSNRYTPGYTMVDGGGQYLVIDTSDVKGFAGRFGPYGVVVLGCGRFTANKVGK